MAQEQRQLPAMINTKIFIIIKFYLGVCNYTTWKIYNSHFKLLL